MVMSKGGFVKQLENYGEQRLAYKMRKDYEWFNFGRQWSMKFFSSPEAMRDIRRDLKLDPIIIRHNIVKVTGG